MDYIAFVVKLDDPVFNRLFATFRGAIDTLAKAKASERRRQVTRLIRLQNTLVDLIEFLDPEALRISHGERTKLALPKDDGLVGEAATAPSSGSLAAAK
jgi:hypothetical protein